MERRRQPRVVMFDRDYLAAAGAALFIALLAYTVPLLEPSLIAFLNR